MKNLFTIIIISILFLPFSNGQDLPFQELVVKEISEDHAIYKKAEFNNFQDKYYLYKGYNKDTKRNFYISFDQNLNEIGRFKNDEEIDKSINMEGVITETRTIENNGTKMNKKLSGFVSPDLSLVIPIDFTQINVEKHQDYVIAKQSSLDGKRNEIYNRKGELIFKFPDGTYLYGANNTYKYSIFKDHFKFGTFGKESYGIMNLNGDVFLETNKEYFQLLPSTKKPLIAYQEWENSNKKITVVKDLKGSEIKRIEGNLNYINEYYYTLEKDNETDKILDNDFNPLIESATHEIAGDYYKGHTYIYLNKKNSSNFHLIDKQLNIIGKIEEFNFNRVLGAYIIHLKDNKEVLYLKDGKTFNKESFYKEYTSSNYGYYPAKNKNTKRAKYGLIDSNGQQVLAEEYDYLSPPNKNGYLKFSKNGYGIINTKGKVILAPRKDVNLILEDDLIIIKSSNKYEILKKDLTPIIANKFKIRDFKAFADGNFSIKLELKKTSSSADDLISADVFMSTDSGGSSNNKFQVGWNYVDKFGNLLFEKGFKEITPFNEGMAIVTLYNKTTFSIDYNGKLSNTILKVKDYQRTYSHLEYNFSKLLGLRSNIKDTFKETNVKYKQFLENNPLRTEMSDKIKNVKIINGDYLICNLFDEYVIQDLRSDNKIISNFHSVGPFDNYFRHYKLGKTGIRNYYNEIIVPEILESVQIIDHTALVKYEDKYYLLDLSKFQSKKPKPTPQEEKPSKTIKPKKDTKKEKKKRKKKK